jgi:hypothetical protein
VVNADPSLPGGHRFALRSVRLAAGRHCPARFFAADRLLGANRNAAEAKPAPRSVPKDLHIPALGLRVGTPAAAEGTALKKNNRPDPRAIVDTELLNVKNNTPDQIRSPARLLPAGRSCLIPSYNLFYMVFLLSRNPTVCLTFRFLASAHKKNNCSEE